MARSLEVPKMTIGRASLVGLMDRYVGGLMAPFVTLLEVHKLMYFLQEAGEPLKLRYAKGLYGPYAENLRQPLARIEGHLISGYADGGDNPEKQLELIPGVAADAYAFLEEQPSVSERFDRVVRLVDGFETPFGLELLATVHWVATREGANSPDEAEARVYAWGERKRRFTPRQIRLAWDVLAEQDWIPTGPAS